jgi:hypothetical protein
LHENRVRRESALAGAIVLVIVLGCVIVLAAVAGPASLLAVPPILYAASRLMSVSR